MQPSETLKPTRSVNIAKMCETPRRLNIQTAESESSSKHSICLILSKQTYWLLHPTITIKIKIRRNCMLKRTCDQWQPRAGNCAEEYVIFNDVAHDGWWWLTVMNTDGDCTLFLPVYVYYTYLTTIKMGNSHSNPTPVLINGPTHNINTGNSIQKSILY